MLSIKNLNAKVGDFLILNDITFDIVPKTKTLLMGPNGSGKSTLVNILLGVDDIEITQGEILLSEEGKVLDFRKLNISQRAQKGLFVGFQQPVEIPGVSFSEMLFSAYRKLVNGNIMYEEFYSIIEGYCEKLGIEQKLINRGVNEALSGGERKKMELLQMVLLKPKYVILDEPDSGMDADAVNIVKRALNILPKETAVLIISHHAANIGIEDFDNVLILKGGSIVERGGKELISKVEQQGYDEF